jgi:hypothetical protein
MMNRRHGDAAPAEATHQLIPNGGWYVAGPGGMALAHVMGSWAVTGYLNADLQKSQLFKRLTPASREAPLHVIRPRIRTKSVDGWLGFAPNCSCGWRGKERDARENFQMSLLREAEVGHLREVQARTFRPPACDSAAVIEAFNRLDDTEKRAVAGHVGRWRAEQRSSAGGHHEQRPSDEVRQGPSGPPPG